ncbi:hypothetical protein [Pedobacter nyackensis]|uniref:hypothetical protein n=1 Tax=Pedobacter nyackensis TaxID=475255 RepID=UPI00292EE66E|nr:hypothetical protein [Pedobacter nyackensis]
MTKRPLTDQLLGSLIKRSLVEAPSPDFDNNLMLRIEKEASKGTSLNSNMKMSMLFFMLGTGFGLLVSHLLPILGETLIGIDIKTVVLIFQLLYIILILTQLENIIRLFSQIKLIRTKYNE